MNSKVFSLFALALSCVSLTLAQNDTTTASSPVTTQTVSVPVSNGTTNVLNTTIATKPATTTIKAPATTTMNPEPQNTFSVKSGNTTCIKLIAKISFDITYEMKKSNVTSNKTVTVPVGNDTKSGGTCQGNQTQTLVVTFNKDWTLTFQFSEDKDSYDISSVTLKYTLDSHFPNAVKTGQTMIVQATPKSGYQKSSSKGYYQCNSNTDLTLENVKMSTQDLKYQAFNAKGDIDFKGPVSECSADEDTNSIVPIAVGAALAGLVVIVLIAYLIGRKRTRKTGYESV